MSIHQPLLESDKTQLRFHEKSMSSLRISRVIRNKGDIILSDNSRPLLTQTVSRDGRQRRARHYFSLT